MIQATALCKVGWRGFWARIPSTSAGLPLALVGAVRSASHELLTNLTTGEWDRVGVHSESGAYSVDRWLEIYAGHCHEHADQIRRARRGED